MVTARDLITLKMNELRVFVRGLVSAENSKQLKRWIKTNWEFFKPYLEHIKYWSKDKLPSLRYKDSWFILAIAIQKILKEQKISLLMKQWEKMNKLDLQREYLKTVQLPINGRKLTKFDLIHSLKTHYQYLDEAA